MPIGVKDLYATEGVHTQACSHILDGFKPPYKSTVTANLWRDGAVMLGKLNMDEFAMGSSNETSYYGPVASPWLPPNWSRDRGRAAALTSDKRGLLTPGGSSGGSASAVAAQLCLAATASDTGGSIRQPAAFTGIVGIKPTYGRCSRYGMVAFASSLDQAGPLARTVRDAAIMLRSMAGPDPKDSTCSPTSVPDYEAAVGRSVKGMKIGVPKEYRLDGMSSEIDALWARGAEWLRAAGASVVDVSLPHTPYALPAYYIVAPAEASSNLARYDGVRYGLREPGADITDLYEQTRARGFGTEVRRRLMIGTYVLSAGYYDAYYVRAQKIRTLIKRDFERVFADGVDAILTPATPSAAFGIGEKGSDNPVEMYLNDVFTVTVNMAGLPGLVAPAGLSSEGLPLGLQLIGRPFDEETLFALGETIEQSAGRTTLPEPWWAEARALTFRRISDKSRAIHMATDRPSAKLMKGATGDWEVIIGLEVHAQVTSRSKLFSAASTAFGGEPNSHVSLVDAAMPGMLPVINRECVAQAVRTGLGLKAKINRRSTFDRKNYFYPDLPQGYQISQYKSPIVGEGEIEVELTPDHSIKVGIERLHLEQDAGKSLHDQSPTMSFVDLNRSGVALMEIVSKPDMRSADEAKAYVSKLRTLLRYIGSSDGDMEKGNLRADVNVSVRRPGEGLGTRCEIKNVNSIRFIGQAIETEARRQIALVEDGGTVEQETRLFDPARGETRSLRSKEEAHDYRYFPDPDLLPLEFDEAFVEALAAGLPELPDAKRARFIADYGLSPYNSSILVAERETADFFEEAANHGGAKRDAKAVANWLMGDISAQANAQGVAVADAGLSAASLATLVDLIGEGVISGKIAKDLLVRLFAEDPAPIRARSSKRTVCAR